ncbi:uncharacterized protein J4E79_009752 [Alternaria viburni]|uniref:uncharacterized protein n=1 Tax=Alternaria viburni TaxID=566460 RepID=UPI0020C2DEE8|nr:uncharacterized protein J4E79_009752 [Alternaria viburni]KAI4649906.1 hypothetical protein J4E79_009752 [Alternaria viburni]
MVRQEAETLNPASSRGPSAYHHFLGLPAPHESFRRITCTLSARAQHILFSKHTQQDLERHYQDYQDMSDNSKDTVKSPSATASVPRRAIPETMYDRVKHLPEYKAWVAGGGLARFANEQDLETDFVDHIFRTSPQVQIAYDRILRTMPSLLQEMTRDMRPEPTTYSQATALQAINDYEQGSSSAAISEDDDDSAEKTSNPENTSEKEPASKQTNDVVSRKTRQP